MRLSPFVPHLRRSRGRVGRDFAVKILPQSFASDAARMARFKRSLAAEPLNHPNIAQIYGVQHPGLVMARVEAIRSRRVGPGAFEDV